MSDNQKQKLLTDFPPVPTSRWEEVITADLKGADYQKKLVWRTAEGFNVRPYYRAEDLDGLKYLGAGIAQFPYVRSVCKSNMWRIHQTIEVTDPAAANALALKTVAGGADSIGFCIGDASFRESDLDVLLRGIEFGDTELVFCGAAAKHVATLMVARLQAHNIDAQSARIGFLIDPLINCLTLKGKCACGCDAQKCFERVAKLVHQAEGYDRLRFAAVNGQHFHNSGGTIVQELAFTLAAGHDYLVGLMGAGLPVDKAARTMRFSMAVSSNYFMEIAKFRAARMLWANIVKAYGPEKECAAKMRLHAVTSKWNTTAYDPYVNMLRGTTEAMSAAIAGVHSLEVTPFDHPFAKPAEFSSRIARNVQLLLRYESHFDNVVDPSGGSYYIENLTASIADQAWELFRRVEDMGGYAAAFKAGFVQQQIGASAAAKDAGIATRRTILLGTNQYPNFTETADAAITDKSVTRGGCECGAGPDGGAEPLVPYRGAMAFEAMRLRVDRSGRAPKAFMLTCGNLSMARARAQFACNFFACAGIRVIDNTWFADLAQGVEQALAAGADIVVVCASDDDYAAAAPRVRELLGDSGAILVVAGAPACQPELEAAGITHFISVRNNVLDTLQSYLGELGI